MRIFLIFALISILAFFTACTGSLGYKTESSKVDRYPKFPNVVTVRKLKTISIDTTLQDPGDVVQMVGFSRLDDGKSYLVILYKAQSFRGALGRPKNRFLPMSAGVPVPHPSGVAYVPDSPEVKEVFFLLREGKNNGDTTKWRFFEYPSQDWSTPIKIPLLTELPLCADSPITKDYPSYISESNELLDDILRLAWYDNI